MPRKLKVATIQMDATPAPVPQRLERAARLIADAAGQGAQLILLPEVFNTGYEYSEHNYTLPEAEDGQTLTWMKAQAAQHNIHLSGSFMLLDEDEVYNSAFIVAPEGRTWRYDKQFPYAWERAYFREGQGITVADTEIGKLGMMICWDHVHPELWARYAGKVDAMLIPSCPPAMTDADLILADGTRLHTRDIPMVRDAYQGVDMPFGSTIDNQAAWLRVPVLHTTGSGKFSSALPAPVASLMGYVAARPEMWSNIEKAEDMRLEAGFYPQTKIVAASGEVLARVTTDGDNCAIAEIELADETPLPIDPQPRGEISAMALLFNDVVAPVFMTSLYREGLRRQLGQGMAPVDARTKIWTTALVASSIVAFGAGWLFGRKS